MTALLRQSWSHRSASVLRRGRHASSSAIPAQNVSSDAAEVQVDSSNKTIATAVGDLPVPPVLDPSWQNARNRHKTPKPLPDPSMPHQRFERQLFRNPYARALASPIRQCRVTQTRLPSYFLQDFKPIRHPEQDVNVWVPTSLATKHDVAKPVTDEVQEAPSARAKNKNMATPGRNQHLLARRDLVKSLGAGKGGRAEQLQAFMPVFSDPLVWRSDMDEAVLKLLRQRLVADLVRFANFSIQEKLASTIVRLESVDDAVSHNHRGCLLWLSDAINVPAIDSATGGFQAPLVTISGVPRDNVIPLYLLSDLLGRENISVLKGTAELFATGDLFLLRARPRTLDMMGQLWKLYGYINSG